MIWKLGLGPRPSHPDLRPRPRRRFRSRHGERHRPHRRHHHPAAHPGLAFGPREAVPIMAVVALMSNFAKITSWWKRDRLARLRCLCAGRYSGRGAGRANPSDPAVRRPSTSVLGVFSGANDPRSALAGRAELQVSASGILPTSPAPSIGFLTGVVVSTGPLSVPAFAAYGLVKGAFIATEAAGSLALYISKAVDLPSVRRVARRHCPQGTDLGLVGDGRHLHRAFDRG